MLPQSYLLLQAENAVLRKFGNTFETADTQAKCRIIDSLRNQFPLKTLLDVCRVKRSTYYKARRLPPDKDIFLKTLIRGEFDKSGGAYGYRRITASLRSMAIPVNHKKVYRLMRVMGIRSSCRARVKKYSSFLPETESGIQNLLARNFHAERPFCKWVADTTEFHVCGRKLYLSAILDLYNREIVSYTLGGKPSLASIVKMTARAGASLPQGCTPILHSDNGWQFRDRTFKKTLRHFGIVQSMSSPGKCHDNAVAENFFSIVKTEFFYRRQFRSVTEFRGALADFLWYYNNKRIKNKFQASPVQFRERESFKKCAIVY